MADTGPFPTSPLLIIIPVVIGCVFGLGFLYCVYRAVSSGHYMYTCTYSKSELLNVLKRNPRLGRSVHRVDVGLYRITGHKFLYPDRVPVDPNFFDGLMTLQQFAQVMVMINTAIIEVSIGQCKVPCTCDGGYITENGRSERYAAATAACRQATAYLRQNNVRAVVYQTIDHELRRYLNHQYQGTDWDTSIYISFQEEDVGDLEVAIIGLVTRNANPPLTQSSAIPVATAVASYSGEKSEFSNIQDPRELKLAKDLRKFYNTFDPSRTAFQIQASASWAMENGVAALNEKLREKYGHDLTSIVQEEPPV